MASGVRLFGERSAPSFCGEPSEKVITALKFYPVLYKTLLPRHIIDAACWIELNCQQLTALCY